MIDDEGVFLGMTGMNSRSYLPDPQNIKSVEIIGEEKPWMPSIELIHDEKPSMPKAQEHLIAFLKEMLAKLEAE